MMAAFLIITKYIYVIQLNLLVMYFHLILREMFMLSYQYNYDVAYYIEDQL